MRDRESGLNHVVRDNFANTGDRDLLFRFGAREYKVGLDLVLEEEGAPPLKLAQKTNAANDG